MKTHVFIDPLTGFSGGVQINGESHFFGQSPVGKHTIKWGGLSAAMSMLKPLVSICVYVLTFFWGFIFAKPIKPSVQVKHQEVAASEVSKPVEVPKVNRACLASLHHTMELSEGVLVKLTLLPATQAVERKLCLPYRNAKKRSREPWSYQYVSLSPLSCVHFNGSDFCLQTAVAMTRRDIDKGLLQAARLPSLPSSEFVLSSIDKTSCDADSVASKQSAASDSVAQDTPLDVTKQASGTVVSMGLVDKQFGDKPKYQTYEMVVRKDNGDEVSFAGRQLEDKAKTGEFKLGDIVLVRQGKVSMQKTTPNGKTFTNTANVFEIKII